MKRMQSFEKGQENTGSGAANSQSDHEADFENGSEKENESDWEELSDLEDGSTNSKLSLDQLEDTAGYDLKYEREAQTNRIMNSSLINSLVFHPKHDLLACALLDGSISLHNLKYDSADLLGKISAKPEKRLMHHETSCRSINFSLDGKTLFSASADKSYSIVDLETQKFYQHKDVLENPINTILSLTENLVALGDDDGIIKIFDTRTNKKAFKFEEHDDCVTQLAYRTDLNVMLSIGADGHLNAYDLSLGSRDVLQSKNFDDELTSIAIIKNNTKVAVGTDSGAINLFSWGLWGDMDDRFTGLEDPVHCIFKVDEDRLATGDSEGNIKVINIHPNRFEFSVGTYEGTPVEHIAINQSGQLLATTSTEEIVHFWRPDFTNNTSLFDPFEDETLEQKLALTKEDVDTSYRKSKKSKKEETKVDPGFFDGL